MTKCWPFAFVVSRRYLRRNTSWSGSVDRSWNRPAPRCRKSLSIPLKRPRKRLAELIVDCSVGRDGEKSGIQLVSRTGFTGNSTMPTIIKARIEIDCMCNGTGFSLSMSKARFVDFRKGMGLWGSASVTAASTNVWCIISSLLSNSHREQRIQDSSTVRGPTVRSILMKRSRFLQLCRRQSLVARSLLSFGFAVVVRRATVLGLGDASAFLYRSCQIVSGRPSHQDTDRLVWQ